MRIDPKRLQLIVYDFDGVMTDNCVLVSQTGDEYVTVNRGDGFAVAEIAKLSIPQIILSSEKNPVVAQRAQKLKINAICGVLDKRTALEQYLQEQEIDADSVLFIGNDLNDYSCMMFVGFRGCPAEAEPEILAVCDWVSVKKGGSGVIRDLLRMLTGN